MPEVCGYHPLETSEISRVRIAVEKMRGVDESSKSRIPQLTMQWLIRNELISYKMKQLNDHLFN